jgi:hypothetical protein
VSEEEQKLAELRAIAAAAKAEDPNWAPWKSGAASAAYNERAGREEREAEKAELAAEAEEYRRAEAYPELLAGLKAIVDEWGPPSYAKQIATDLLAKHGAA